MCIKKHFIYTHSHTKVHYHLSCFVQMDVLVFVMYITDYITDFCIFIFMHALTYVCVSVWSIFQYNFYIMAS